MNRMKELQPKMIFEHTFKEPIKAIDFNVSKYISYNHDQDCCENVYIDMEHINIYRPMIDALGNIIKFEVWTAPEDGIIVFVYGNEYDHYTEANKRYGIYLPCRNEQNGFYSNNLDIIITVDGVETKIDISDSVYDDIE